MIIIFVESMKNLISNHTCFVPKTKISVVTKAKSSINLKLQGTCIYTSIFKLQPNSYKYKTTLPANFTLVTIMIAVIAFIQNLECNLPQFMFPTFCKLDNF